MALSNGSSKLPDSTSKGFWTPGRVVLTVIAVGLLTGLGVSSCQSSDEPSQPTQNRTTASAPPAQNAPPPANAFVALPHQIRETQVQTIDGASLKLSDYADKVVVVNIWATWCGPCKAEMPDLVKLYNEYKSQGLVVIGLATTYNEANDPQRVKDFVRAQKVNYKIVWDDGTLAAPLVQVVHGANAIPQSFVISRDGRIMKHFQGFSPYSTPALMRQAVEQALSEKG